MPCAIVAACERCRFFENMMPTCENRRSTAADVAGQPRYWRAMTASVRILLGMFAPPQARASFSVLHLTCGMAR